VSLDLKVYDKKSSHIISMDAVYFRPLNALNFSYFNSSEEVPFFLPPKTFRLAQEE
jgi:hypothetical protein